MPAVGPCIQMISQTEETLSLSTHAAARRAHSLSTQSNSSQILYITELKLTGTNVG
jgi:hypothetical protein